MEWITDLKPLQIFVFGSNISGIHGAGAAKQAMTWGAIFRKGEGIQGRTYAIPTKGIAAMNTLSIEEIKPYVDTFRHYAQMNMEYEFLVTEIGCGLAGLTPEQVAPLFNNMPLNVKLPKSFIKILNK
jgi:hypothetical protein